ncbi:MAG: TIGR03936 family radical SAM-associated protein [Actinobacteria bacterium]|nr:TIGR03936 family radical SAM-associated protein [Actinomycetota bacterium]
MTWWLLTFSRGGPAAYLSHLDTARAVQRTFARAGVPIALSHGMRPKPRLSLPLPLPVGAAGCEELAVVEVPDEQPGTAAVLRELRAAAPPGLLLRAVAVVGDEHPRPQALEARYACLLEGDAGAVLAAVERYATEVSVVRERVSPKGRRTLDLKEYVVNAASEAVPGGARLSFSIRHRDDGAARPQEFIDLIATWAEVEPVMRGLERQSVTWKGLPSGPNPGAGRSAST